MPGHDVQARLVGAMDGDYEPFASVPNPYTNRTLRTSYIRSTEQRLDEPCILPAQRP